MRFLLAGGFFSALDDSRICHLDGPPGRGKTSLAVCVSYVLHQRGVIEHTISNFPLAWCTPVYNCPHYGFCALLDEGGIFFDSRSFADKHTRDATLALVAMPRHLNAYVIVSSRVTPDARMRHLQVQHVAGFSGVVDVYEYAYSDGSDAEKGKERRRPKFLLLNRRHLWSVGLVYPRRFGIAHSSTVALIEHFNASIKDAREENAPWAVRPSISG